VFGSKILPTILIIVPATVLLSAQASLSEPAAEECKAGPGTNTPRGAHWYYRINRAKQHCWYLGVADGHTNAAAVTPAASTAASTPQKGNAAGATRTAAAAPAAPAAPALTLVAPTPTLPAPAAAASAVPELPRGPGFVTRWPENLSSAEDLDQQEPAGTTNSYADGRDATEQAGQQTGQTAPKWPLAAADRALPASGEAALQYFSIAGALAIPLLLTAGWAARFTRRPRPAQVRDQRRTMATRPRPRRHADFDGLVGIAPLVADRHGDADWQASTPTDPAYDLKTSLAELMRDLRRAGAFEPVQAAEQPAEELAEQPAEELAEHPAEESVEQPAEESAEQPAEESAEQPAQQTSDEETSDQVHYPVLEAAE
jgi:hypothetical protein